MLHSQGRPEAGRHVKEQWLAEPNSSVTGRGAPLSPQVGKVETFGHQYAFARAPVWWRGEVWTGREERGDTIIYLIRPACDPALRCQAIDSSPSSLPRSPLTASLPRPCSQVSGNRFLSEPPPWEKMIRKKQPPAPPGSAPDPGTGPGQEAAAPKR